VRLIDATVDDLLEALRPLVRQEVEAVLQARLGEDKKYLSVDDASKLLSIGPNVVYDAIRRGELQPKRFGRQIRFKPEELEAWGTKNRNGSG
jgi:excisionase family DNA binding protein